MRQKWVLGLAENDLAYENVLTRVTPGTTNSCKTVRDIQRNGLHGYFRAYDQIWLSFYSQNGLFCMHLHVCQRFSTWRRMRSPLVQW